MTHIQLKNDCMLIFIVSDSIKLHDSWQLHVWLVLAAYMIGQTDEFLYQMISWILFFHHEI